MTAGVTHVFLWLFRASRRGFKGTFRAVAYANAANLFFIIPSLGMMAAGVWGFVCLVGGLSGAQATGKARVFFALLTPLVLLVVLLAVLAFFFGLGGHLRRRGDHATAGRLLQLLKPNQRKRAGRLAAPGLFLWVTPRQGGPPRGGVGFQPLRSPLQADNK